MKDEFPADIDALLASEREAPGAPAAARARLLARLDGVPNTQAPPKGFAGAAVKTLAVVAVAAGAGWLLWPGPEHSVPAPSTPAAAAVAGPAAAPSRSPEPAGVAALAPEPEPAPELPSTLDPAPEVAVPAGTQPLVVAPEPAPSPRPEAAPGPPEPPEPAPEPAPPRQDLDAERRLVDAARAALNAGRPADALRAVRDHRQRFPRGALVEERESLRVRATASVGRPAEAARLRRAFLARWPQSVYRASLQSLPAPSPPEPAEP